MSKEENDKSSNVHRCLALLSDAGQMSESLGLLLGAIAHDFRNHLTVIKCWSDMLLRPGIPKEKAAGHVQRIRGAAVRAIELTEQLLAFSDPRHAEPTVVNLNKAIDDIVKLAESVADENVHLRTVDCSDMGNVRLEYGRFQQALLCVILHARDTLPPEGGEITVKCSRVSADENARPDVESASSDFNILVTITSIESGSDKQTSVEMHLPWVCEGQMQKADA